MTLFGGVILVNNNYYCLISDLDVCVHKKSSRRLRHDKFSRATDWTFRHICLLSLPNLVSVWTGVIGWTGAYTKKLYGSPFYGKGEELRRKL